MMHQGADRSSEAALSSAPGGEPSDSVMQASFVRPMPGIPEAKSGTNEEVAQWAERCKSLPRGMESEG